MRTLAAAQFGAASISLLCSEGVGVVFLLGALRFDQPRSYLISAISMCASVQCPDLEHQMRSLGPHSEIPK